MFPGGKNGAGVYQRIISLMPPHKVYIEPFLGSGAILRNKRPALANIGMDLDAAVIEAWKTKARASGYSVGLELLQADAIEFLASHEFTPQTLVYCDPPYVLSTRSHRRIYQHEMSDDQHRRLLDVLNAICDNVFFSAVYILISGYWSKLYEEHLHRPRWHSTSYQAMTRGGRLATETIWFNFPKPAELHDYRHLGEGFRERERIQRKIRRWTARLSRLPALERNAILAAIMEAEGHARPPEATMSAEAAGSGDAAESLAGIERGGSSRQN